MSKLKTIGVLTTQQLNSVLNQFPKSAKVERHESIITVHAPNGDKVLSAMKVERKWHVMAVEGLINKVVAGQ